MRMSWNEKSSSKLTIETRPILGDKEETSIPSKQISVVYFYFDLWTALIKIDKSVEIAIKFLWFL